MSILFGVVMDPIRTINTRKDSTFAMLLAAQARGWQLHYMEMPDLCALDGRARAKTRALRVRDDPTDWFDLGETHAIALSDLDCILMRKDPPFDMEYIYATYILELAEREGSLVINRPASLRDTNEKVATSLFPQCCPETLISRDQAELHAFIDQHGDTIIKPLDGMGGASIFRVRRDDPNRNVILETLTEHGSRYAMLQRFVPEIAQGDKRILMVDGEAVPYALARIPAAGEARGNLAAGGRGEGVPLAQRDYWIVEQVAPYLRDKGILFAGLDVIGDYLTEINVTSPTCIRELDALYGLDIAGQLMDRIEYHLGRR